LKYFSAKRSDFIGACVSTLCVIHCLVTPFIFVVHSCSSASKCCGAPVWWKNIDFIFLFISFASIYQSTKTTTKPIMKPLLWGAWGSLLLLILNEKIVLVHLPEVVTYVVAISLAFMHLYNLRYCQCTDKGCCID